MGHRLLKIDRSLLFGALCALLVGCVHTGSGPEPRPVKATDAKVRVPVVLVPGITGTELIERSSGQTLWGRAGNLIRPKDDGYSLARPLTAPIDAAADDARPGSVLMEVRLGPIKTSIYGPLIAFLERAGYTFGDLEQPRATDDLFAFGYDWRGDNIFAAGQLRQALDALADSQEDASDGFEIDLICQSNGAHICRYLAKYGGAPLELAESGQALPSPRFHIRKIILVGTSNGGSLRILRELDRGRKYLPLIGRTMQPEVLFSFPSIFQDLPMARESHFLDGQGKALDLDLGDAATWIDEGWSIFNDEARERTRRRPDLFADETQRRAYLQRVLDRASRLHRLLAADIQNFPKTRYYQVQNGYDPTPHLAIRGLGAQKLVFTGDKELEKRPYLRALASRPGDGHASLESQQALSAQELAAIALPTFLVRAEHFQVIIQPESLQRLLEFLED